VSARIYALVVDVHLVPTENVVSGVWLEVALGVE
jgi:hypothetical protein